MMRNDGLRLLGNLASGEPVYDRFNSHLHHEVQELLPEVFAGMVSKNGRFIVHEHDFGRIVGKSSCVTTSGSDKVVYARRPKRADMTRFVKNRQVEPSDKAVVILKRDDYEQYYIVITAFVGGMAAKEPWDFRATDEDREFWENHALVWGSEEIIPGTETAVCPW